MIPASLHRYTLLLVMPGLMLAETSIGGPVAGYVADPSNTVVRAILGVPGAFGFSDPLALPEGIARVRVAPGRDFALAERGSGAPVVLHLSDGSVNNMTPVDGAMPSADWVAFSPGAAAAVLFSSTSARLQILTGLPDSPAVALDLDATTLPEQPLSAAVSDDGGTLLVASGRRVYLVPRGAATQPVLSAGAIVSMAILPGGSGAVVADRNTGSIHLLQNLPSAPAERVLVSGMLGVGKLYPSGDGTAVYVSQPGIEAVSAVDLTSGEVRTFPTGAAPVALVPLRNRDTFLISAKPGQPGWIFFRDGDAGRSVFIPAAQTYAAASEAQND